MLNKIFCNICFHISFLTGFVVAKALKIFQVNTIIPSVFSKDELYRLFFVKCYLLFLHENNNKEKKTLHSLAVFSEEQLKLIMEVLNLVHL